MAWAASWPAQSSPSARRGSLAGGADRRRGVAGRRGLRGAAGQAAPGQGRATGARAGHGQCQSRCRGNQGEDTSMTAEELHQEIEQTRQRLGETVDELAAKTDVKARARAKAAEAKVLTRAKAAELSGRVRRSQLLQRRWPVALAAGALIAGSVAIWRWKKT